jgi:hypothetical protein
VEIWGEERWLGLVEISFNCLGEGYTYSIWLPIPSLLGYILGQDSEYVEWSVRV